MKKTLLLATTLAGIALLPAGLARAADAAAVLDTYGDIAEAAFAESVATAEDLSAAVDALIAKPSDETLAAARKAWLAARRPYQQTEVYRFGNAIVDDWEGKVNAWPLDEGLIDYVDAGYGSDNPENAFYTANVIANPKIMAGGREIDATEITPASVGRAAGSRRDRGHVATGYHAVEFLLWGQDLNGTDKGAGRPSGDRLRHGQLHRRKLRASRRLSEGRDRAAAVGPEGNGGCLEGRRCRPRRAGGEGRGRRSCHDPDRHGLAVLR